MKKKTKQIDLTPEAISEIRERLMLHKLLESDYEILDSLTASLLDMIEELNRKSVSINRLRKMLFGHSTEKTSKVLKKNGNDDNDNVNKKRKPKTREKKIKGHGRNGADDYTGAEIIRVEHDTLKHGGPCPECLKGKVYLIKKKPGVHVRITGGAPLKGKIYECDCYRCNLCNKIFKAELPKEAGSEKYDETVASTIGNLKYGSGLPFNRLEKLQENVGVPIPASTQWEIVDQAGAKLQIAFAELIRSAAQGDVIHNDDTPAKIIELMLENSKKEEELQDTPFRKGIFTTGIISIYNDHKIALFFTGRNHAGENLAEVLKQRESGLDPPIQMCDALSRNPPKDFKVILAHCIAHARRKYVDVVNSFPSECKYVLETLKYVYKNDAITKDQKMSPEARLEFHKKESKPLMDDLHNWCERQFEEKKVEENSSLGHAISYMLDHWKKLTLFLRKAGAPLDNNIVERSLKKAILHRKNSLFYKTENGARVGDIYMSLIHTCNLCCANAFEYLTVIQKYYEQVYKNPADWMPWNYKQALLGSGLI